MPLDKNGNPPSSHWTKKHSEFECSICGSTKHYSSYHNPLPKTRVCKECCVEFPLTAEFFHEYTKINGKNKDMDERLYFDKTCIVCSNSINRKKHIPIKQKKCSVCGSVRHKKSWHEELSTQEKKCLSCKNIFSVDNFNKIEKVSFGGDKYIRYNTICKACESTKKSKRKNGSRKHVSLSILAKDNFDYRIEYDLSRARGRSLRKDMDFDLTTEFVMNIYKEQDGKCYYSGDKLTLSGSGVISIDRIDSSKGYTKDNIVLCCGFVNVIKNAHSQKSFVDLCGKIWNYSKDKELRNDDDFDLMPQFCRKDKGI